MKKETIKFSLIPQEGRVRLAPPPPITPARRIIRSHGEWVRIHTLKRLNGVYQRTEPYRKELNKALNAFIALLGMLVICLVWASIISKVIMKSSTNSEFVLWIYNLVAFGPALICIILIAAVFIGSHKYRKAIAQEYAKSL